MDYMQFSDEVESIFTHKNLEKTPTAEVQQFVPPVEVDLNILSPEEEQILQKTMHRLAERVRRKSGRRKKSTYYISLVIWVRISYTLSVEHIHVWLVEQCTKRYLFVLKTVGAILIMS